MDNNNKSSDHFVLDSKALIQSEKVEISPSGATRVHVPAHRKRGSALRQVIAAFIANLGTISTGLTFGFSAVAIPQLEHPNSTVPIDEDQASWIASLSSITTPIGCLMSGFVMDQLGRRTTLILLEVPAVIGWVLIAFAGNVSMIYGGRLLVGLGSGMVAAPSRVYTGEVTQPHLRGTLAALASLGVSLGVLVEYALGAALAWHVVAAISAVVPLLALMMMIFMPESPGWLLSQGREGDARKALGKFRGQTCDVKEELDDLIRFSEKNHVTKLSFGETLSALIQPSTLKPFAILAFYFFVYQFSGVNAITFYAVEIFTNSASNLNSYTATVIMGGVRFTFTLLACVLMRRCGRRPLTMFSGIGCGLTMIGLGSYMYLLVQWENAGEEPVLRWFPVACIFVFIACCTVGFLVVPWVMIGEVYPSQVRGIMGGLTTCTAHLYVFTVVKTFPYLIHSVQKYGAFWIYGSISLVGTIILYFLLPETKGKSLEEIEDYFSGRTNTLSNNKPKLLQAGKGQVLP